MVLNDTSTKLGLLQDIEMKLFGDNGYGQITGNTNRLYQFTARVNRRQDRFIQLAFSADGRWQYDDTNNTDYPIATTNIVSGQRDYPLTVDMLEVAKVTILNAASGGVNMMIYPFDINDQNARPYIENNTNNVGVPYRYDKTANSIILDPVPNYSATAGLKIFFKRGANYFVYTDTTKVPGFAAPFHEYLSAGAALDYAVDRNMTTQIQTLSVKVVAMEAEILSFFSDRNIDEQKILVPRFRSSR